jgi:hypothetical protein
LPSVKAILAPLFRTLPGRGRSPITLPRMPAGENAFLILPTRQWARVSLARAFASVLP